LAGTAPTYERRFPLDELESFPIGVSQGRRAYLCRADEAIKYDVVEFSKDFTEHYGEKVYVCFV